MSYTTYRMQRIMELRHNNYKQSLNYKKVTWENKAHDNSKQVIVLLLEHHDFVSL
jgi:hypothetical protein